MLNGMFIEERESLLGPKRSITATVAVLSLRRVVDISADIGTLVRMIVVPLSSKLVEILEPFPPRHGGEGCHPYENIRFVRELGEAPHNVLVSADVLEHVVYTRDLIWEMVRSVQPQGHPLVANCFHPVIACHLHTTFHLHHSFVINSAKRWGWSG